MNPYKALNEDDLNKMVNESMGSLFPTRAEEEREFNLMINNQFFNSKDDLDELIEAFEPLLDEEDLALTAFLEDGGTSSVFDLEPDTRFYDAVETLFPNEINFRSNDRKGKERAEKKEKD